MIGPELTQAHSHTHAISLRRCAWLCLWLCFFRGRSRVFFSKFDFKSSKSYESELLINNDVNDVPITLMIYHKSIDRRSCICIKVLFFKFFFSLLSTNTHTNVLIYFYWNVWIACLCVCENQDIRICSFIDILTTSSSLIKVRIAIGNAQI